MYLDWNATPTLMNCTISGNWANTGAGGVHFRTHPNFRGATLTNCIVWENVGDFTVVQFTDVGLFPGGFDASTFQIIMTNLAVTGAADVWFLYDSSFVNDAAIGLENETGTVGFQLTASVTAPST